MKKLIAYGKDIYGNTLEFEIENGVLNCHSNLLLELKIPVGVEKVFCGNNQLTELILPEGVEMVYCWDNQLTHLELPDSVTELYADKEVTGLENHVGKVKMNLY